MIVLEVIKEAAQRAQKLPKSARLDYFYAFLEGYFGTDYPAAKSAVDAIAKLMRVKA